MQPTRKQFPRRAARGMALVIVLVMVVVITALVAFAITVSGRDNTQTGKRVHNLSVQNVAEGALQYARAFFSVNYLQWNKGSGKGYLGLVYPTGPTASGAAAFKTANPELFPTVPAGYACLVYARDDADELPPALPDPGKDNNQLIYVGATCVGPANISAEVSGALIWDASRTTYGSQSSGGAHGTNNYRGANNQAVR